ncbi:hypothetical protein BBJ28_00006184 [Nothophytophthora sp. Chile5]|nr:hypothetical protein BBJ28_00006184 [Nothophytophthora sp. Chile5]
MESTPRSFRADVTTPPTVALDDYDFEDTSTWLLESTTQQQRAVEDCGSSRRAGPRSSFALVTAALPNAENSRATDSKTQDPVVFAQILADEFLARESVEATPTPPTAVSKQQLQASPPDNAVSLGSFGNWQFGERCLATYRVLFGRPLWSSASPRPLKRKHSTSPTSCSSDGSDGSENSSVDQLNRFDLVGGGGEGEDLLPLPTVDELLELQTDETLPGASETEDVLAGLVLDLDVAVDVETEAGTDAVDLLWSLEPNEVDEAVALTEAEEEELRFLVASPAPNPPDGDDLTAF